MGQWVFVLRAIEFHLQWKRGKGSKEKWVTVTETEDWSERTQRGEEREGEHWEWNHGWALFLSLWTLC